MIYISSWPEPYVYAVYDCIFGEFPAKNTVHAPYMYGSGQPYIHALLHHVVLRNGHPPYVSPTVSCTPFFTCQK